ncbi:hypothetical protein BDY21DRAFT_341186 [Lineolata rhizophorae]|uniref:serine--tRNA ligase n=1 Tax=Lineolata rhizophorae TaxID=578093 RepID=A0A6A6P414_9PEZI|nr:hypothetical protein BDY21DRAFT_341186 [Lineolata rhizophorae]
MRSPAASFRACSRCRRSLRVFLPEPFKRAPLCPLRGQQRRANTTSSQARPPTAPKAYLDIKHIRQNPGLYEQNCIDRNYATLSQYPWRIIKLHEQWLNMQRGEGRRLRERSNKIRRLLKLGTGRGRTNGQNTEDASAGEEEARTREELLQEAKALKVELARVEELEKGIQDEIGRLAWELPNLTSGHTPLGETPTVLGHINEQLGTKLRQQETLSSPSFSADPSTLLGGTSRSHTAISAHLNNVLDFPAGARTSGWGFYFLRSAAALLEQALIQYALQEAMARGFVPVSPPSLVYAHIAEASGFRPRDQSGETQIYSVGDVDGGNNGEGGGSSGKTPPLVLAGTAEIPLAGMLAGQTVRPESLPLKMVGVSRCYRAEAGARGAETKGLYRVHEFTKVELFGWAMPPTADESSASADGNFDTSASRSSSIQAQTPAEAIFADILSLQSHILTSLNLHARLLELPSADLGASATRKLDHEAYFPSRAAAGLSTFPSSQEHLGWGELTSASLCTDYQARRLGARVKLADGSLVFLHSVNGTACAVPRVLAALIEQGWDADRGMIWVPECLRVWMRGREWVGEHL